MNRNTWGLVGGGVLGITAAGIVWQFKALEDIAFIGSLFILGFFVARKNAPAVVDKIKE